MSSPEPAENRAERLLKQAKAILGEIDPDRRKTLPLDEPPTMSSTHGRSRGTARIWERASGLHAVANHVRHGNDPSVYDQEDLKREIQEFQKLL